MKVLSLFDGISCGRVALERAGIPVEEYHAWEIDKHAIQVSRKNFPSIEQHGDVTAADFTKYRGFDLLIGGSPCQGFSVAGKQLNFEDPRSRLYFEFERALQEAKPKWFLLENVGMKKEYADIITERLGVQPIVINSGTVSAQNRKRLYWTNIPGVQQPPDKGITLRDIVHEFAGEQVDLDAYKIQEDRAREIIEKEVEEGKVLRDGDGYLIHGTHVEIGKPGRYLFGCLTPNRVNKRQNGRRFSTGEKYYTLTSMDDHGFLIDGYLRTATPVECERLQTLPDGYTEGITERQRFRCLGNGWTVDVIAWILSFIPVEEAEATDLSDAPADVKETVLANAELLEALEQTAPDLLAPVKVKVAVSREALIKRREMRKRRGL